MPFGKSGSLQELLKSTKKNGGSHAICRDNYPWISKNANISIVLRKRRKRYFFTDFLGIRLDIRKQTNLKGSENYYMANGNMKTIFGMFLV